MGFLDSVRAAFSSPRLVWAGIAAAVVMFLVSPLKRPLPGATPSSALNYVTEWAEETESSEDEASVGTAIEEYFL